MEVLLESKFGVRNSHLFVEIYMVQNDLVKQGKKRGDLLKISEEELLLNNHRCCY